MGFEPRADANAASSASAETREQASADGEGSGSAPVRSSRARSTAVDMLRGIAVLSVMLHHLPFSSMGVGGSVGGFTVYPSAAFAHSVEWGKYGVHLFLVISGFCIHMPWASGPSDSPPSFVQFWRRRLTRLYPPYLAVVLVCLLMLLVHWRLTGNLKAFGYGEGQSLLIDVVLLLLLAQNLNGASHRIGDGPLWSLALEEQLYLLYFPLLWMRKRWGWTRTLLLITLVTVVWRWVFLTAGAPNMLTVGPSLWLIWAFGAFAVEVYTGRVRCPRWCRSYLVTGVVLGCAAALINAGTIWGAALGVALLGPGFFLLVVRVTSSKGPSNPIMATIARGLASVGIASYSLYLVHDVGYKVAKQVVLTAGGGPVLALIARIVVGVGSALILYRLLELPAHRWARSFKLSSR
jgi:peptidoglycan/LPS O-acetylase OafA/YrhL